LKTKLGSRVTELFGLDYPIFLGGMAWLGTAELAGAVSAAGGLGIIGAGAAPAEWVAGEIAKVRSLTSRPFGVNVLLVSPHAAAIVDLVCRERVPVVTTGAGNPGPYLAALRASGVKVVPVVSAVSLALRLVRSGADAVVAEGEESGGHIGQTSTLALTPQVVDALAAAGTPVPVIAAGGIADGRGLAAALALGASGVQMGTRFVCATECIAHPAYKQAILKATDRATAVTGHSTGHPVRAIRNALTREFDRLEAAGRPKAELEEFGAGRFRAAAVEGDTAHGTVIAGQCSGLVRSIDSAAFILETTVRQAETILNRLGGDAA
jgi:enoyl-[acyl-carrier protein] reductase II